MVCVPNKAYSEATSMYNKYIGNNLTYLEKWVADLKVTWSIILICFFIAFVVGYYFLIKFIFYKI